MSYVELHACSAFSFLRGGSFPEQLAEVAAELEMPAMALLDRNGVYGAQRFSVAAAEQTSDQSSAANCRWKTAVFCLCWSKIAPVQKFVRTTDSSAFAQRKRQMRGAMEMSCPEFAKDWCALWMGSARARLLVSAVCRNIFPEAFARHWPRKVRERIMHSPARETRALPRVLLIAPDF
jgi:hypothetical protein